VFEAKSKWWLRELYQDIRTLMLYFVMARNFWFYNLVEISEIVLALGNKIRTAINNDFLPMIKMYGVHAIQLNCLIEQGNKVLYSS